MLRESNSNTDFSEVNHVETVTVQINEPKTKVKAVKAKSPFKFKKPKDDIDKAIQSFLKGEVGKFGHYVAVPNALLYRRLITDSYGKSEVAQNIIAMRLNRADGQLLIGNSSALPLVGRSVSFGRESLNRSVSDVQTRLSAFIQMVPFSVFQEAGLNLASLTILERGPEETIVRDEVKTVNKKEVKTPISVHYTGASLFTVGDKTFLFDIDRREVKHRIFNPFLVQLNQPAKTIAEAYENLKPQAVKDAEKQGLTVLRQGEWFFIPVKGDFEPMKARSGRWDKKQFEPLVLQAGNNRANEVSKYAEENGMKYCTGMVEHRGREHAALTLKGWFIAVPNTSISSFTITGDVD